MIDFSSTMTCLAVLRSSRMPNPGICPRYTSSTSKYKIQAKIESFDKATLETFDECTKEVIQTVALIISSTATTPTKSAVEPPCLLPPFPYEFASDEALWVFWFDFTFSGQWQDCEQGILIADILSLWMTTAMLSLQSSCSRRGCHEAHSSLDIGNINTIAVLSNQPLL
jgi:hypothetical protein